MIYKHTDDKHGTKRIEMIEFDDNEYFDDFIAEVSELLWGDSGSYEEPNGEIVCPREPYCVEESIDRLKLFSNEALAWLTLSMWCGAGDQEIENGKDTDEKMNLRNFMNSIMKEVKQ
jgi:hypothetical protein